ncbi:TRAP transporter small permease subunit, partial [Escherichia coli]|nr:TRAP transporter small permease subunit [Escherichia coli]
IMVYGGGLLTLDTFDSGQTSPALGWQMGYIYMSIPISGILIIIYTIDTVLTELKQPL